MLALSIRMATGLGAALAVDWAAKEGWNPGVHDAEYFYNTDPGGFFTGEINGEPVACISAVSYGSDYGFIGFYIVRPEFRGKGFGLKIWNHAIDCLNGRVIGLDGVPAQQENYKKYGFQLAYRNIRYRGAGGGGRSRGIVNLADVPFQDVLAYDSAHFFVPRPVFLRQWINQPEGAALGYIKNGRLAGFGVLRACREGYKIGPLFADDPDVAERLYDALAAQSAGAPFFLDIPEVNSAAVDLAQRHNMQVVFETARMYTGKPVELPVGRIYGVTSFELG